MYGNRESLNQSNIVKLINLISVSKLVTFYFYLFTFFIDVVTVVWITYTFRKQMRSGVVNSDPYFHKITLNIRKKRINNNFPGNH